MTICHYADQVAAQLDEMKGKIMQDGQPKSPAELQEIAEYMNSMFEEQLTDIENQTYNLFKVTEEEVTAAYEHYENEPECKAILQKIMSITARVSDLSVPECPEHITESIALSIMAAIYDSLPKAMEASIAETAAKRGMSSEAVHQSLESDESILQDVLQINDTRSSEMKEVILKTHGIDHDGLKGALLKYSSKQTFVVEMQRLNEEYHQRLKAMGLGTEAENN
jgi:hypothetical protein